MSKMNHDKSGAKPTARETFNGGNFQTNAYIVKLPQGNVLIDAPEGALQWARRLPVEIDLLVLTHSHFDHVEDAAAVVKFFGCECAYHPWTRDMAREAEFFRAYGLPINIQHVNANRSLEEGPGQEILGESVDILHVPGHHPASICLYFPGRGEVYVGDTLFAGSIGRTDLPDGDHELLVKGIREKLFALPDETLVFPGHGPSTYIGNEKLYNPYLHA